MKNKLSLLLLLFCIGLKVFGQQTIEPNLKFGKPSNEEFAMTTYSLDSTANAVILYDIGQSNYQYEDNEFSYTTQHRVRIKILKPEGEKYANVTIPYYFPEKYDGSKKGIPRIEAYAYRIENGKRVKSTVKNESIVHKRIDDEYMQLNFSIPSVQQGSIIEYRYTQTMDSYLHIDDWMMQADIPVIYNEYKIEIPKIFTYTVQLMGKNRMQVIDEEHTAKLKYTTINGLSSIKQDIPMPIRSLTFTARNLPGIPNDDKFQWCSKDNKVHVVFELQGVQEQRYESYTKTWDEIDKLLLEEDKSEYFGKLLSRPNPFSKEIKELVKKQLPTEEMAKVIFHLLKQKFTWNGEYQFYSKNLDQVITNGSGSNADLNFILISMLQDADIEALPVALRRRDTGKLPMHYPSLQNLNTFVVGIRLAPKSYIYLDSSMDDAYLNVLPPLLSVENAHTITKWYNSEKWVDLTSIAPHTAQILTIATLTPEQKITGSRETIYTGLPAVDYIKQFGQAKDSMSFIKDREIAGACQINNFKHDVISVINPKVKENIEFTRSIESLDGQHLYINPMIFMHLDKNSFTQAIRNIPVDMECNYTINQTCHLTLPEGYEIEEIPLSQTFATEKQGVKCTYQIQQQGPKVTLNYQFTITQLHFGVDAYPDLQAIWTAITEKNNAPIVLKKL